MTHKRSLFLTSLMFATLIGCARIQVADKSFSSSTLLGVKEAASYYRKLFTEQRAAIQKMKLPRTDGALLIHHPGYVEAGREIDRVVGLGGGANHSGFMHGISATDYTFTKTAMEASGLFSHADLEESQNVKLHAERAEYAFYMTRKWSPVQIQWTIVHTKSGNSKQISVPTYTGYTLLVREVYDFIRSFANMPDSAIGLKGAVSQVPGRTTKTRPATTKLAVMDIEDRSGRMDRSACERGTDYFRALMNAEGAFVVIDRSRQSSALSSMISKEKTASYQDCYDESCQIPLGQALAADTIIRTQINRIADFCTISSELVDLAKEAVVGGGLEKFDCTETGLSRAIEELIKQVALSDKETL